MAVEPGGTLSHYRLVEKIGEGGMGVVYRAEDTKLRRQVALKVLPPELVANQERRLRFLREARTAAAVNHPNIAHVYEIDEADGVVFITMELVDGKTLRKQMGGKALPMKDTLRIATEMAEALAQAHKARIIHRDLKPDNVIIAANGHIKILDFGLAKLHEEHEARLSQLSRQQTVSEEMTREGKIMGTPAYMSPEQARGQKVDARSDIFAFGTTLYEMATGIAPFRGKTMTDTLSAVIRDEPIPASQINAEVPPELERIIGKCLEKELHERYRATDELVADLTQLKHSVDTGMQRSPMPSIPSLITHAARKHKRRLALLGAIAVLLIVAGIVWWGGTSRPAGNFNPGDRVLITDFVGNTGRPALEAEARDAFEVMMSGSSFLDVLRGPPVDELLTEQGVDHAQRMSPELASRLCATGVCAGFLGGQINRDGLGYSVTIEMFRSGHDEAIDARTAGAAGEEDLLMTIHGLVVNLRQALGETPLSIAKTIPPTTRSLQAYQAYAAGTRANLGGASESVGLYRRAIELDPEFVQAYMAIARNLSVLGDTEGIHKARQNVYRLRARLPERNRLRVEIKNAMDSFDWELALDRAKVYAGLYPDDRAGHGYLCLLGPDLAIALNSCQKAFTLAPSMFSALDSAVNVALVLRWEGDADGLDRLVEDLLEQGTPSESVDLFRLYGYMVRGDDRLIRATVDRMQESSARMKMHASSTFLDWLLASGRHEEAGKETATAWRAANNVHDENHLYVSSLREAWLAKRRDGAVPDLPSEMLDLVRNDLSYLPEFATYAFDIGRAGPLASLIRAHESATKDAEVYSIREELAFSHACLALINGENQEAREILEPLARISGWRQLVRRHRMLGRAYEGVGRWQEAAGEYEIALENPHLKWYDFPQYPISAVLVLEQHRLAGIYDRLGDTDRARHWYERFTNDWKDADLDIPELIEARARLSELNRAAIEPP